MSHNSRRWTPATVWILQKMVWIIEIFGQSPRFSLAETKISPALRFMEIAFWAVFAGISHSAGVQRSDLWVKLNQRGGIFIVSEAENVSSSVGTALNRTCRPAGAFCDGRSCTINMPLLRSLPGGAAAWSERILNSTAMGPGGWLCSTSSMRDEACPPF